MQNSGNDTIRCLNIGIDIDGTVTDPYFWLSHANRHFNKQVTQKDVTCYEIHKVLGVDEQAYREYYDRCGAELHRNADIRLGVKEVLGRLKHMHRLHFITARNKTLEDVSIEWLERHELPYDTIIHTGSHHKADCAKELKCDLFIEDCLNTALELSEAGIEVLLLNCNYNKAPLDKHIIRVNDWFQIERIIEIKSKANAQLSTAG